jgi:dienelactone hydrolase
MRTPRFLICLAIVPLLAADPAAAPDFRARARAFVKQLAEEDYAGAGKDFDATMRKVLPGDKLAQVWTGLLRHLGPFKRQGETRSEQREKLTIVYVSCQFERSSVDAKVVFRADGQITGLFFVPPRKAETPYQAPEYVRRDAFHEVEVRVGESPWVLPGTLSLPEGRGPFRAVVLVHGSGPGDEDQTMGPNRPLRDLAWGLASRGIAVLRYEKRTRVHAARLEEVANLTVKEEVLDDVRAAFRLLKARKEIDGNKVFVAGHSLGGMLVPRIARDNPGLAGLIALAGSSRPLEESMIAQLDYLLASDPTLSAEHKREMEALRKQAVEIKAVLDKPDGKPAGKLLGAPVSYWRDLRAYSPLEAARAVKQPLLILQGERDYQVTLEDFARWKVALAGRKDVTFKSYPQLNHLFLAGKGKSLPAEYERPGHVAAEVVEDVAAWVQKH